MYTRILVGTDGSNTAGRAVARAVDVAATTGATLTIVTAGRGPAAEAVVDDAAREHGGAGIVIDTKVVDADPVSALVDTAAQGYDLLVVGNKGMTGVRRFFPLGSVPNKLAHIAKTNLLIVRTT